jgi:arylsulfatase A-like enzyme
MSILTGIDGWLMYETGPEIVIDIGARIVISLVLGSIGGTIVAFLSLTYVLRRTGLVEERCEKLNRLGIIIMILVGSSAILGVALRWAIAVGLLNLSNQSYIVLWSCLSIVLVVVTLTWNIAAPGRFIAASSAAYTLSGRSTRRLLLAVGIGALFTAFSDRLAPGILRRSASGPRAKPGSPNILLVTFDALCAEDMSVYGYHLPTTPNMDALSRSSAVFSNYYATSTFTTPCIASMLTGRYPSDTHVYHYGGRLRGNAATQTLANALRAAGYTTAASVANPGAHPDCLGFGGGFDVLPPPPIEDFATAEAASMFHSATLAADAGFAGRITPYLLEQLSPRMFGRTRSDFPPALSFRQSEEVLAQLSDPFFLWIHVYAPHFPYLPDPPFLKSFLQNDELRTHSDFAKLFDLKGYNYSRPKQPLIDKARLRYDEWIAQADHAFGEFMGKLRSSRRFDQTAVIVSADHGESFQGGYVGHGGPRHLRPVLHVPLLIHLPGQAVQQNISRVTDHTSLAPTILEIAGIARPDWMDGGQSLNGLLRGEGANEESLAFTQYFEANSAFKPVEKGTVGAIDGRHQYVFNLETKIGELYDLDEAQEQRMDLAQNEPTITAKMHNEIKRRFPRLLGS